MSRAQGDGFRTWTDTKLNEYKFRLWKKTAELRNEQEKWWKVGENWICTTTRNTIENPNGDWKWNGWQITGQEYEIWVFPKDVIEVEAGKVRVRGCSIHQEFFNTIENPNAKNDANAAFLKAKEIAKNLK